MRHSYPSFLFLRSLILNEAVVLLYMLTLLDFTTKQLVFGHFRIIVSKSKDGKVKEY